MERIERVFVPRFSVTKPKAVVTFVTESVGSVAVGLDLLQTFRLFWERCNRFLDGYCVGIK